MYEHLSEYVAHEQANPIDNANHASAVFAGTATPLMLRPTLVLKEATPALIKLFQPYVASLTRSLHAENNAQPASLENHLPKNATNAEANHLTPREHYTPKTYDDKKTNVYLKKTPSL